MLVWYAWSTCDFDYGVCHGNSLNRRSQIRKATTAADCVAAAAVLTRSRIGVYKSECVKGVVKCTKWQISVGLYKWHVQGARIRCETVTISVKSIAMAPFGKSISKWYCGRTQSEYGSLGGRGTDLV